MNGEQMKKGSDQRTNQFAMILSRHLMRLKERISQPLNLWFNRWKLRQQWQILIATLLVSSGLLALSLWLLPFGYPVVKANNIEGGHIGKSSDVPKGRQQKDMRNRNFKVLQKMISIWKLQKAVP